MGILKQIFSGDKGLSYFVISNYKQKCESTF